jgi:hypothetical protein
LKPGTCVLVAALCLPATEGALADASVVVDSRVVPVCSTQVTIAVRIANTDVNCDNATTVQDVVKIVNVAFRAGSPATEFCIPCP